MTRTKTFWTLTVVGWAVMAFGVAGLLQDASRTKPVSFAIWFFGALVVHDFVIAPAVFLSGHALRRVLPRSVRATVVVALVLSGLVALYAAPLLAGVGRRLDNPSLHPSGYALPVLVVLALIWTAAIARRLTLRLSGPAIAAARARTRSSPPQS